MAGLSPEPLPGARPLANGDLIPLEGFEVGTILEPLVDEVDADGFGCKRQHPRLVAPPCRPVTLRIEGPAQPSRWFYADILDISYGGLCVLITDSQDLEVGEMLTVDFKAHRLPASFGSETRIPATLRWFVRSGHVTTMGVGFGQPLSELPELLPERRNRLRDPNLPADAPAG
jgi:hypothetical protein